VFRFRLFGEGHCKFEELLQVYEAIEEGVKRNRAFFKTTPGFLTIHLFPTHHSYEKKLGRKTEDWEVGYFNPKTKEIYILTPTAFERESCHSVQEFPKVLIHEITHLFLETTFPFWKPVWLAEGLALYLARQNPQVKVSRSLLRDNFLIKLASPGGWRRYVSCGAYRLSLEWVRFLIERFGREKFLTLILSFSNLNGSFEDNIKKVFKKVYESSLLKTKKSFIKYLKKERR
jgi:hypothetical protein